MDNTSELVWKSKLKMADVLLAVSWRETEAWIRHLKEAGARTIYRISVFAMQYKLPIIHNGEHIPET